MTKGSHIPLADFVNQVLFISKYRDIPLRNKYSLLLKFIWWWCYLFVSPWLSITAFGKLYFDPPTCLNRESIMNWRDSRNPEAGVWVCAVSLSSELFPGPPFSGPIFLSKMRNNWGRDHELPPSNFSLLLSNKNFSFWLNTLSPSQTITFASLIYT